MTYRSWAVAACCLSIACDGGSEKPSSSDPDAFDQTTAQDVEGDEQTASEGRENPGGSEQGLGTEGGGDPSPVTTTDGSSASTGGETSPDDGQATPPPSGCGRAAPEGRRLLTMTDMFPEQRQFDIFVPLDYDPNIAYPLVFAWHGRSVEQPESLGLLIPSVVNAAATDDAIIVLPLGQQFIGPEFPDARFGWDFSLDQIYSRDVDFFDTLLAWVSETYCVDRERVFSFGFSNGASFTNLLGCLRGDVIRAIAPVSGWGVGDLDTSLCKGPVATHILHGQADVTTLSSFELGEEARDFYLQLNSCTASSIATPAAPLCMGGDRSYSDCSCVLYEGCSVGNDVVWCEHSGGHDFFGREIASAAWEFFQSIPPRQ